MPGPIRSLAIVERPNLTWTRSGELEKKESPLSNRTPLALAAASRRA
jgi:hypothetical protein